MASAQSLLLLLAEDGVSGEWLSLLPSVRFGMVMLDTVAESSAPNLTLVGVVVLRPGSGWPGLEVRPYAVQRLPLVVSLRCGSANGVVSHPSEIVLVVVPRSMPVAASVQAVVQSSQAIAGGLGSGGGAEALTMGRLATSLSSLSCDDAMQGYGSGLGVLSVSGAENAQQCIRLSVASRRDDPPALLAPFLASTTKEDRRAFHEAIAKACSNLHCRVAHGNVQITVKRQNNNSNRWKRLRDEEPGSDALRSTTYTHCVVEKRNVDSFQMQSLLAEAISSALQRDQRVTAGAISIAGTKDKKAVTFQRVSFRGEVSDADIARLLDQRFFAGGCTDSWVAIRSIKSGLKAPIQLGALSGNHFTITVHTPAGMESIFPPRNFCFLNYFGPQRFGRCAALSDYVGVHLIGGRYCEAVEGVLRHLPSSLYDEIVQGGSVGLEVVRRKVNANAHRDCAVILEAVVSLSRCLACIPHSNSSCSMSTLARLQ